MIGHRAECMCGLAAAQGIFRGRARRTNGFALSAASAMQPGIRMRSLFFLVAFFFLVLAGCKKKPAAATANDPAILAVLQQNLAAMNRKDSAGVMATIHPESPNFATTEATIKESFGQDHLRFTVLDWKVATESGDEATVIFKQKTEKVGGTARFDDNILEGTHTLKKDRGTWKIVKTVPTNVTLLTAEPTADGATPAPPKR